MRRLRRPKKPDYAVFDLCVPYSSKEKYLVTEDVGLQLDALLLQLNTGVYIDGEDEETEDEMAGTESEEMLAEADRETQSARSMNYLNENLGSGSLSGIVNTGVDEGIAGYGEGDAPIASQELASPSMERVNEAKSTSPSQQPSISESQLQTPDSESGWPNCTDSIGNEIGHSRDTLPSYPDSGHEFFKPPATKAREVIKRFLKDGEHEKVFLMLNRALKSDLNLDNAIYRILDILEKRRIDLSTLDYLEKETTASLLHTALLFKKENATKRLVDRFPFLMFVHYTSKKYKGRTCFHIAVANNDCSMVSKMLCLLEQRSERKTVLNTVARGSYFVKVRPEASTCLASAAWMGQLDMIERLIVEGADLEQKGVGGNTLLHTIVALSIKNLNMLTARKLFKCVYENSGWWWSDSKNSGSTLEDDQLKEQAFHYLMRIPNEAGLTPIGLAITLHSPLTPFIMSFEPVYKLHRPELGEVGMATHDVTGLLSYKCPDDETGGWSYDVSSGLHVLAHTELVLSTQKADGTVKDMAEMEPINSAIEMKWKMYKWLYIFWGLVHLSCMLILTCAAIRYHDTYPEDKPGTPASVPISLNFTNGTNTSNDSRPLWPVFAIFIPLSLIYLALEVVDFAYSLYCYFRLSSNIWTTLCVFLRHQFVISGNISFRIILSVFSLCLLISCGMYYQENPDYVIPLSLTLVLGWIFMLYFTKGCRHLCRFTIMIQKIFFNDFMYFLVIYTLILIGFSAAMHLLAPGGQSLGVTFFLLLNAITNADSSAGSITATRRGYAMFVLGVYGLLTAVLLITIFIAVVSTSYELVKSSNTNLWRFQQLSISLMLERRFFWWTRLCKLSQSATIIRYVPDISDPDNKRESRVYLNVPECFKH